ncbi:unnamed protein product [Heligmosomoides polygyrus]|uniref:Uncharacterized protein n=1 Tax=Heligmosomoides polygyrus TaxID=6339 RepID=A0A3P8IVI1_HELPZ|nr:unnamed protein product [Heligmosomoides polygyrus]
MALDDASTKPRTGQTLQSSWSLLAPHPLVGVDVYLMHGLSAAAGTLASEGVTC